MIFGGGGHHCGTGLSKISGSLFSRVAGSKIPGNLRILKFPGGSLSSSLCSLLCLQRGALRRRTGPVCYGINVRQSFIPFVLSSFCCLEPRVPIKFIFSGGGMKWKGKRGRTEFSQRPHRENMKGGPGFLCTIFFSSSTSRWPITSDTPRRICQSGRS